MTARWDAYFDVDEDLEPVEAGVPEYVRTWEPVAVGTPMRRPVFAVRHEPPTAAPGRPPPDEDAEFVRRQQCRHRSSECPLGGNCGAPVIVLPARELGRVSGADLLQRGEAIEPSDSGDAG